MCTTKPTLGLRATKTFDLNVTDPYSEANWRAFSLEKGAKHQVELERTREVQTRQKQNSVFLVLASLHLIHCHAIALLKTAAAAIAIATKKIFPFRFEALKSTF